MRALIAKTMWLDNIIIAVVDVVIAWFDASRFSLSPPAPRIIDPRDQWFYVHAWQQAEREVDDDLRAGRYEDFTDMDQVIVVLKENDPTATARLDQVDRVALALRRFRRKKD